MVNIRGDDKVILIPHQLQKVIVDRLGRILIAVNVNIPAPIRPEFFLCGKRIESAAVHILNAVLLRKVGEMLLNSAGRGVFAERRTQNRRLRSMLKRSNHFVRAMKLPLRFKRRVKLRTGL